MAKIYGINGYKTGKVGNSVFVKNADMNIERQYVAQVVDRKSNAQLAVRAKFKLLNQVAAAVAPYIAIKKKGIVSPRNQFVSRNFEYAIYQSDTATLALADMQLTDSAIALCGFSANRAENKISCALSQNMANNIDAVAYVCMSLSGTQELTPYSSIVVSTPGDNGYFPGQIADPAGDIVVYAYGVRYNRTGAYDKFGQLNIVTADALANLVVTSNLSNAIGSFTETRGMAFTTGETSGGTTGNEQIVPGNTHTLTLTKVGFNSESGTVSGAGEKTSGASVTVSATSGTGQRFNGWYSDAATQTLVSFNNPYTFVMPDNDLTLYANFEYNDSGDNNE